MGLNMIKVGETYYVTDIKLTTFNGRQHILYRGYIKVEEIRNGEVIVSTPFYVLTKDCKLQKLFRIKKSTLEFLVLININTKLKSSNKINVK